MAHAVSAVAGLLVFINVKLLEIIKMFGKNVSVLREMTDRG